MNSNLSNNSQLTGSPYGNEHSIYSFKVIINYRHPIFPWSCVVLRVICVQSAGRQHGNFVKQGCQTFNLAHGSSSFCTFLQQIKVPKAYPQSHHSLTFPTAFITGRLHLLNHSRTNLANSHFYSPPFTPLTCPHSSSFSTNPAIHAWL